jgi:hypothetical protein
MKARKDQIRDKGTQDSESVYAGETIPWIIRYLLIM